MLTALQGTLQTNLAPLWAGLDKTMALRLVMTALVLLLIWFSRALALRWIKHKPDTTPGRFFSWKKTTFYIAFGLTVLVIMQLWTESLQLFFTFLGLVAAALVITLKEPFMSLAGALFILWRKPFGVGDRIEIDIPAKKLNVLISDAEIEKRLAQWKPMKRELKGYLKRYAQLVRSAHTGATFE